MAATWQSEFLFAVCQHGAEAALKRELAIRSPELRLAFSRPGLVTLKHAGGPLSADFSLPSSFARTWGWSLGQVQGEQLAALAAAVWELPALQAFCQAHPVAGLHVWQRDERTPGDHGYEPGPTPLAAEAEVALRQSSPLERLHNVPGAWQPRTVRHRWVLDAVLVEPNRWLVGCHRADTRIGTWIGGVPPLEMPPHAVSRAWLKMAEAIDWAAPPMQRGEIVVELGCAPGGASQMLLDAGLRVLGVDPAEVDDAVAAQPGFRHLRARTHEVSPTEYQGVRWVAADMNVAPAYTLDAVEAVVKAPAAAVRGLLLTLKLADWELVEEIPGYVARVQSWGFQDVRVRQLAFNRREICLAAMRSRGQRRILRTAPRPRLRRDGPHHRLAGPHSPPPPTPPPATPLPESPDSTGG